MALGDLMASRLVHSSSSPSPSPSPAAPPAPLPNHHHHSHVTDGLPVADGPEPRNGLEPPEVERPEPVVCLPQVAVLREQRHEGLDEAAAAASAPSTSGLVSKWRPKDRVMDLDPVCSRRCFLPILLYRSIVRWIGWRVPGFSPDTCIGMQF
jgi:regulator-associated protein of mTOR